MMAFYKNSRSVGDKDALEHKLAGVPTIILDGLTSRFTEKERTTNKFVPLPPMSPCARILLHIQSTRRPKMTPQAQTMLLTYMFALCLRIDDYAKDTESVAHDLGMSPAKLVTLFSGCSPLESDTRAPVSMVSSSPSVRHLLAIRHPLIDGLPAGCIIKKLSPKELKERGLPDAAAETKRAVLKSPFEFPKSRVRRARR